MFSPLRYKPPTKIEILLAFTLHKEEIPQASGLPLSIIKCEPWYKLYANAADGRRFFCLFHCRCTERNSV